MLGSNVTVRRTSVSVTPGTRVSNLYSLPAVLLSLFAAADPRSLCVYLPFPHSCVHGEAFHSFMGFKPFNRKRRQGA